MLVSATVLAFSSSVRAQEEDNAVCTTLLRDACTPCLEQAEEESKEGYSCSRPGLQGLIPGQYEGISANYLSYLTDVSSPNFPVRAKEFEACTGGKIHISDAANAWEDPIFDLGTKSRRGSEVYDAVSLFLLGRSGCALFCFLSALS